MTAKHILEKIQKNQAEQESVLDLRGQSLRQIPEQVRELSHLKQLLLADNQIQSLPSWLSELKNVDFIQLNMNPLHDVGAVENLVLDWGVWWRLRQSGKLSDVQIAGLWLRWEEGDMLEAALALPLRWLDLSDQRLRSVPDRVCQCEKLQILYLNNNKLSILPAEIGQLQNLSQLNLFNNQLSTLPAEIGQLQNLSQLYLSSNKFSTLPAEIGQLQNLSQLDLRSNKFSTLPAEIGQLQNLSQLYLSSNQFSTLPAEIGQLQNLSQLDLSSNQFSTLPAQIGQLQNLSQLYLSSNKFSTLPAEIGQLQNLSLLYLRSNQFSTLPAEIGQLQNLSQLYLSNNQFSTLPAEIGQLQNLSQLCLGSNKFSILPAEIGQLQNLSLLVLIDNELSTLPAQIGQLQNLSQLDLGSNQFSTLPAEIGQLQNLSLLDLSSNQFSTLPAEIGQLQNLSLLHLKNNGLSTLPAQIGQLQNLSQLYLGNNKFSTLPAQIGQLQNLSQLYLGHNGLSTLPAQIGQLQNLSLLDLSSNQFSTLPAEIGQLQNLSQLYLGHNGLSTLPAEIGQLQNLSLLDLSSNQFSTLPAEIGQLHDLRALALKDNPLEKPPLASLDPEDLSIGGYFLEGAVNISKLRIWLRDAAAQNLEPIYEAKTLIIGEGGAGKTSLAWRLIKPDGQMPNEEQSTEGIDIWQKDLDCLLEGKRQNLRLNIWDFGGQDIYHATHQFFLSHNALYILVADTRRDDTDFYWWLSIVEKLGGDSPVLLVKNERDERLVHIDEGSLRKRFAHLKNILSSNLATKRGLDEIVSDIRHHASQLKHVGELYPKLWKQVREALEQHPKPHITWDEYIKICCDIGLQEDSASALMTLLHNLGVCLYFEDVPLLAKTVILKPTWATEAVYRVLDDREVQMQTGYFTLADVQRIWQTQKKMRQSRFADCLLQHEWQPEDYKHMHHELLAMMQKFELCYSLPNEEGYIAPSLLQKDSKQGSYDFPDGGLLILYGYSGFMPKGLTGHLLVRRFQWIEEARTRAWRYGAVLDHDNTRAEIIEDRERREFSLRLVGMNCRDMATVLMDEMATIHKRFKGLDFKVSIPCQCGQKPEGRFDLDYLRRAIYKQKPASCPECFDSCDAEQILNGVFTPNGLRKFQAQPSNFSSNEERTMMSVEKPTGHTNININAGGDVSIGDDFTGGAKTTIDSYNNNAPESLVSLLQQLSESLATAQQTTDVETAKAIAEQMHNAAKADKPNKGFLNITVKGLLEATKTVVGIVPNAFKIATLIKQVLDEEEKG